MAKDDQEEAFDKILTVNLQRVLDFLKSTTLRKLPACPTKRSKTPAILMTEAVYNGLKRERPQANEFKDGWLTAFAGCSRSERRQRADRRRGPHLDGAMIMTAPLG
jgi:hypothetical protein